MNGLVDISKLSVGQLQKLIQLQERKAQLESEMATVVGLVTPTVAPQPVAGHPRATFRTSVVRTGKRGRPFGTTQPPKARAKIRAAQKARWAAIRAKQEAKAQAREQARAIRKAKDSPLPTEQQVAG